MFNQKGRLIQSAFLLLVGLLLSACLAPVDTHDTEILTSPQDTRQYRYLELGNRLRVVLVSDSQADKAAAALRVNAGSGQDPVHRQGLAHFLEHMLFMGTKKYPDVEEYMKFIRTHGGTPNAYTASDHTNYFFDIDPTYLDPALDRFAQFFIAPLFTRAYVEREMNAVESEYSLNIQDDLRRELDVFRETVNPDHPLAKFAIGNLATLQGGDTDIREDLLTFFDRYYSANLMTLVVFGPESLDVLEQHVARFAEIRDKNREPDESAPALFAANELPMLVTVEPVKEKRELTLLFQLPAADPHWRQKPLAYIGDLLGHEGPGSLLSLLKAQGWAEGLDVDVDTDIYDQALFQIQITLSKQGISHYQTIVGLAFEVIESVRRGGVESWRFSEQATLSRIAFRFVEKSSPLSAVIGLTNAVQTYPVKELLRGPYLMEDFRPELIQNYLQQMTPENVQITLVHPDVDTDHTTQWYQTPYGRKQLVPSEIRSWVDPELTRKLVLPRPNPYLPEDLAVKETGQSNPAVPSPLVTSDDLRVWYRKDDEFAVPRALRLVRFMVPATAESAASSAMGQLFVNMINDELNETTYYARVAGLGFNLRTSARGLDLRVTGYDDRQDALLERILKTLRTPALDPDRFRNLKADLERSLANSRNDEPIRQLMRRIAPLLFIPKWSDEELLEALRPVSYETFHEFAEQLFAATQIEALVYGNVDRRGASAFAGRLRRWLDGLEKHRDQALESLQVALLEPSVALAESLDIDHPDSAYLLFIQADGDDYQNRAAMQIAAQLIGPSVFEDLRTDQQLGYNVGAFAYPLYRMPSVVIYIQSPNSTPQGLHTAVAAFLDDFLGEIQSMSESDYQNNRNAVVLNLTQRPRTLAEQAERYAQDLSLGVYSFDDRARLADAVAQIDLATFNQYFATVIANSKRRSLVLTSAGKNTGGGAPRGLSLIESVADFRAGVRRIAYPFVLP